MLHNLTFAKINFSSRVANDIFQNNGEKHEPLAGRKNVQAKRRVLKKTAVPSCNLPRSIAEKEKMERDNRRSERLRRRAASTTALQAEKEMKEANNDSNEELLFQDENVVVGPSIVIEKDTAMCEIGRKDIGVQTQSGDLEPRFANLIYSDSELYTATGIETFQILNCIVNLATSVYERSSKEGELDKKMNLHDQVVMTYVKLKQNLSFSFLAVLFKVYTPEQCAQVFEEMIQLLSACLEIAIRWPSREENSRNIPKSFKDFPNVRVILDCIEICIEKPEKLCCQLLTHSHRKGSETCKFLTGVTPSGLISFVSKAYGGGASDEAIFENSELVRLLEPGDAVMIDEGLLIDEICQLHKCEIIRPPILKDKKQFSKAEAALTSKIAKARVHIKLSNKRFKKFRILGTTMPNNLVPFADCIFKVICGTLNLSSPILKDDEFL